MQNQKYEGMFLYPDNYSGSKQEKTWKAIEEAGIVFIKAKTGLRDRESISFNAYSYFVVHGESKFYYFNGSSKGFSANNGAGIVRLVKDVK